FDKAGGTQLSNKFFDGVEFSSGALLYNEALLDLQKAIRQSTQLRTRSRLGIERSLPVNRESVHFPASKQPFHFGLRRHCLKYAHLSFFQMAAHKQFLCLSFDGGNFHSRSVNVCAFLY